MGDPILDLNNLDNWNPAYNEVIYAGRINANSYYPILPFDLPVLFTSPLLMILCENFDAKPWWYLGSRFQQKIATAITPGEVIGRYTKAPINRAALFRFPMYAAQYSLKVEIPPWFDRMKIAIWEYSGVIGDSTERLIQDNSDLIRIDLIRIETKIDGL